MRLSVSRLALLGGSVVLAAPLPAAAQDAAPAASPAAAVARQASGPEVISVTARRRKEPLQKVPLTVTVIGGAQAQQNNQNNLQDIVESVPEADFRTSSSNKDRTLFVRGIGTISTSPGVEPDVSTVVDGVVLARSGQATLDLVDLAQVEVLSGPQGTLFGKNASAGVINITTAQPQRDFHAWTEADYFGSGGNEYRLSGGVTGALTPTVSANLSALVDGFGGNVWNSYYDKAVNGYQHEGFRSKFLYEPSDDFNATLALDYLKSQDTVPNGVFVATSREAYPTDIVTPNLTLAKLLAAQGIFPGPDNKTVSNNVTSTANDDNGGIGLTLNKKFGDYTLTSITAYRAWENVQVQDYDQTSAPPGAEPQLRDRGNLSFNQVSEEVRLASPKGGLIDYVVGGYFLKAIDFESYNRDYSPAKSPYTVAVVGRNEFNTDGDDVALFGEGNLNVTDYFRFIAGLRVIRDDLSFDTGRVSTSTATVTGIRPDFGANGYTQHWDYSDRLGMQWDITPDANAYFTYSRGYKGPAYNVFFNMAITDTPVLKPETNNSFEVGLKTSLLDNRVQANISGFIEDFSNYQANFADLVAGAIVTRLINAGSVSSEGVQASVNARPFTGLQVGANVLYDDAHIDQFNCPPNAATSCNVNGEPLPFAPRWKLSSNASYTAPLNDIYDLRFNTDFSWQTRTQNQLTETPDTIQQAYGIWNGSISLLNAANQWRVTGVVKNILDQHYSDFLAYGSLGGVVRYVPRDDSRYFGIEVRKDF
jgi:iron complex outermembrane receptor protein